MLKKLRKVFSFTLAIGLASVAFSACAKGAANGLSSADLTPPDAKTLEQAVDVTKATEEPISLKTWVKIPEQDHPNEYMRVLDCQPVEKVSSQLNDLLALNAKSLEEVEEGKEFVPYLKIDQEKFKNPDYQFYLLTYQNYLEAAPDKKYQKAALVSDYQADFVNKQKESLLEQLKDKDDFSKIKELLSPERICETPDIALYGFGEREVNKLYTFHIIFGMPKGQEPLLQLSKSNLISSEGEQFKAYLALA